MVCPECLADHRALMRGMVMVVNSQRETNWYSGQNNGITGNGIA